MHAELFVAGLPPWEPILHLSIPQSRVQRSPDFTRNLPAADPISLWHHRPRYFKAFHLYFAFQLTQSLLAPSPSFFISFLPTYTLIKIFTPRMLFHTLRHSHCHTYTLVCNVTRIDTRQKQQIYY